MEQVNTSAVEKKKNLYEQNFDGEPNWSGVVNFHSMQMSLVMSMRFIYGDDCHEMPCLSRFCTLALMQFLPNRCP